MKNKRLIVMRHAKSSWSSNASSDHERPLNNRGCRDSPRMAQALLELGWVPELVLSSTAARTVQTWELMYGEFKKGAKIKTHFTRDLYHANLSDLQKLMGESSVAKLLKKVNTVLVLGHNPGWQAMVEKLSGKQGHKMTTANTALLTHPDGLWADIIAKEERWTLKQILRPKELPKKG